jgi:hypothetical protein
MSHEHTWTRKIHHGLNLGEATTFLLIVFYVPSHRAYIQMPFCPESPEIPKIETSTTLEAHNIFCRSSIEVRSKKSYSPPQDLSNDIWHATYTQVNQGNSRLLVVRSQIGTLTPSPSFGHNLCFKHSNGMCEPILDLGSKSFPMI